LLLRPTRYMSFAKLAYLAASAALTVGIAF
jgi:hypothetical protein